MSEPLPPIRVTVLGCGSSGGVPLPTGNWGVCDPDNPKNRRRRTSILLDIGDKTILVDMGPDLREQLLSHGPPEKIDAIILTHHHADHLHGLDDVRHFVYRQQQQLPVFLLPASEEHVRDNMDYIISGSGWYPPLFELKTVDPAQAATGAVSRIDIAGLPFDLWRQPHGRVDTIGFRIGAFAYSTDCVDLSQPILDQLADWQLDVWMVDAVRRKPHTAHAHLDMTLGWLDQVQPRRGILTHMSEMLDYAETLAATPDFVEPAFDGMRLVI